MKIKFSLMHLLLPVLFYTGYVNADIQSGLSQIVSSSSSLKLPNVRYGIIVQSMGTGKVLYANHAYDLFTPASVMKLFTASAALEFLKTNFQFPTRLLINGTIENGVLNGDLYVQFSGDPTLTVKDVNQLFAELHQTEGVNRITGHVYVDNSAFDMSHHPPGCLESDLTRSFAAPMNAVIINHNNFGLKFAPGKVGEPILIQPKLPPGSVSFFNETATTSSYKRNCPLQITSDENNLFHVKGCFNKGWGKQGRSLPLRNPLIYAQALTQQLLYNNNIQFYHPVSSGRALPQFHEITAHYSAPLGDIIKKMVKKSDNVATNAVFKKLAEQYFHVPGSWQNGVKAIKSILSPASINFNHGLFIDGAGLSRYNLISPSQLTQLLYYSYHNPNIKEPLLISLPIAGKDGTLSGRMPGMAKGQNVKAKTGTMKGVTALAGYLFTHNNGTLAFAIIVNGYSGGKWPYIVLQDRICEFLVNAK